MPYLSPPKIADLLGVNRSKVVDWINRGELQAVNVADRPGRRPRWRISEADLKDFLTVRAAAPAHRRAPRHEQKPPGVIEVF